MTEGPQTAFADQIHAEKYRGEGEAFRESGNRISSALADNDEHFHLFREIYLDMRYLPAGRVQQAVGSTRQTTPYNCYVSGRIEDSLTEGQGSIMKRLGQAAKTMQQGGGIGYNFGSLRPRGALIKKLQSQSSGAVGWMSPFNAVGLEISSAGHRRGAQMGVLPVWHPDIEQFIRVKQNDWALTGFNLSIGITDEFMKAVENDDDFDLRFGGEVYNTVKARDLWDMIMRSTWDWAEPGVLFIDRINEMNNLYYCETIEATNPCGEQPLPEFGACLLGSFNLTRYVSWVGDNDHSDRVAACNDIGWVFDYPAFARDIPHVVRAMDNVIDQARYPLFEQEKEAKSKRRMGLGITGTANTIERMGYRYASPDYLNVQDSILRMLRDEAYRASAMLAAEKGPFPLWNKDRFCAGKFFQTLPEDVQDLIREHGLRNSHLTSIAPTGTISLTADNVSSGIEPVFSLEIDRIVTGFDGPEQATIQDYGYATWGVRGRCAEDVTAEEHVRVLARAQAYVDSAVSKTCNVSPDMPWDDFKQLYMDAWKSGAKGCTTFNPGGKRAAMMKAKTEAAACSITGECE